MNVNYVILWNGINSCFAAESTKVLNITCVESDLCAEINAINTYEINMQCIVSDSCDNFNIYANYTTLLTLICEPRNIDSINNIYSSSYASCNKFNIFTTLINKM
eukprot:100801_1